MISPDFDEAAWIVRLGVALEQVAAEARPMNFPRPADLPMILPTNVYQAAIRSEYHALGVRARHDAEAASQFEKTHLWLLVEPTEAISILREHPLLEPGLESSGHDAGVRFSVLGRRFFQDLKSVVTNLAKLTVKEGGEEAARRLHRYLTAGANGAVPAYEISVVHGLVTNSRITLTTGAYIEPYSDARAEFDLPDQPEPWTKALYSDTSVLVRSFEYGPGVARHDDGVELPYAQVSYCFPAEYQVDLQGWFEDSKLLVDLLAIATRAPLLSHTRHVRLAQWIVEIDRNFAFGLLHSGGFASDMWPQGHEPSQSDVDAFTKLARGFCARSNRPDALIHAVRRLAASLSRPGGRFGREDRILDVAIALEIIYGGKTGLRLARRAAALLGVTAEHQMRIFDQAKGFYDTRSGIVHMKNAAPSIGILDAQLEAGRDLACSSLTRLLERDEPLNWAAVMRGLLPETEAHIRKSKPSDGNQ